MRPHQNPDEAFREAVREHFGLLAQECGTKLVLVEAMIFGFRTEYAVLTVGAYPGHFRGICVKLRRRTGDEEVGVKDGADIGLANVEELVTGRLSLVHTQRQEWTAAEIENEISGLAQIARVAAMPFLTSPTGNWVGLRAFVDAKIKNAPKPWIGLNQKEPVIR